MSKVKTIKELAIEQGVYNKLHDSILEDEFNSMIDEGWTLFGNSFEAKIFKNVMSEDAKISYALSRSFDFATNSMENSIPEFLKYFGDMYCGIINLNFYSQEHYYQKIAESIIHKEEQTFEEFLEHCLKNDACCEEERLARLEFFGNNYEDYLK